MPIEEAHDKGLQTHLHTHQVHCPLQKQHAIGCHPLPGGTERGPQSRAAFEGDSAPGGFGGLVMSFFYREVPSAVLVVVSILQSVFGMYE